MGFSSWFAPCVGPALLSVLIVNHDAAGAAALAAALEGAGFRASVRANSREPGPIDAAAFEMVAIGTADAPESRRELCAQLRAGGYAGTIVVLGASGDDVVTLLDAGADDFVAAPVQPADLLARIHVASRRGGGRGRVQWGPLELDGGHRTASLRGVALMLTRREYALLACLAEAGGNVVSRAELLSKIWEREEDPGSNLVEVHLSRLRDKLGDDASLVETVRRAGYRLRADPTGTQVA